MKTTMTEVKPFIPCVDYWPVKIPPPHLAAYKVMIDSGQILKPQVIYNRNTGSTTVEYQATVPHEWILEEMGKFVREFAEPIKMNLE